MEVTGGGIAILSLSIQLIQSINTIKNFVKGVRKAPAELIRLVETLENLSALLQDVDEILKLQLSGPNQHLPSPSTPLFNSLRSCYDRIQSLKCLIDKFVRTSEQDHSSSSKSLNSLRLGLKVKEIRELENGIQREMINLNTSLTLNSTRIQLQFFPAIMSGQQTIPSSIVSRRQPPLVTMNKKSMCSTQELAYEFQPFSRIHWRRIVYLPSLLQNFGVNRYKILQVLQRTGDDKDEINRENELIVAEESVLTWESVLLGFGVRASRATPYGSILPALTTYPVVHAFNGEVENLFLTGSIHDVHHAFGSGRLHPYTCEASSGKTLLHLAAAFYRVDLCQLLCGMGVRPQLTISGLSPLALATITMHYNYGLKPKIDTLRYILSSTTHIDEYDNAIWKSPRCETLEVIEWLWAQRGKCVDPRATAFWGTRVLQSCLRGLSFEENTKRHVEFLRKIINPLTLQLFRVESFCFLDDLFYWPQTEFESFEIGTIWTKILDRLEINLEAYIKSLFEERPNGLLEYPLCNRPNRKLVVEFTPKYGLTLGWEWAFDPASAGFEVVSNFRTLSAENYWATFWPFNENRRDEFSKKWAKRLQRRMASNARKEMKRQGRAKEPRLKIPGSWID